MSAYYFLAASLPMLHRDAKPPFSAESLWERSREHLRPAHARTLRAVLDGISTPHPFAKALHEAETQLRNAVARQRARRLERDPAPHLRRAGGGYRVDIERAVEAAFNASVNPREREALLDGLRWNLAEEFAGFNPFSESFVFAYAVKLRILEKRARENPDKGREKTETFLRNALSESHTAEAS